MIEKAAFKAYDIRGRIPEEVNESLAYQIGRAFVALYHPNQVVVGRDIRLTSESMAAALIEGFTDGGCDVIDIGLCGTEQVYHGTAAWGTQGGVMITASHNPVNYNGLKLVSKEARPISADTGLMDLYERIAKEPFSTGVEAGGKKGSVIKKDSTEDFVSYLLQLVPPVGMKPLKVVANAGNGCAGPVVEALAKYLPIELIPMNFEPDGTFPNGIPNPLLPERRQSTSGAVLEHGADLGIAWDGDFDRCFFFDHKGRFIDSYYIVGFLAEVFLQQEPGGTIIYDPRLIWNTEEIVNRAGGHPVESRGGHAFMKATLRKVGAIYGGEASGHHFFRDFHYCDSGMLPWLYVVSELCRRDCTLAEVVDAAITRYPVSGEMNRQVDHATKIIDEIEKKYAPDALRVDHLDGLSIEFSDWRFNLRTSNTEPLTRLNMETRGNSKLLQEKTEELLGQIGGIPQE